MTAGANSSTGHDYPSRLSAALGWGNYNGGVGGNTSTQIRTRFDADTRKGMPTIIWAGRNNWNDPTTVKADIAAMVAALTTTHYLVLSVTNSTNEPSGTANYDTIIALNADLAATYGAHFVDVRGYLVSLYNPDDPTDVADHANDVPPNSLRSDFQHLNDAGYQAVADKVYESRSILGAP